MIYPNGSISLNKLFNMISNKDYNVFVEINNHKEKISEFKKLLEAIELEYNNQARICYEFTSKYFEKNPADGDVFEKNNVWKYSSSTGDKYIIKECSYIGDKPEIPSWELAKFFPGEDFNGTNYSIASFDYNEKEYEYEFHSVGSRLFKEIANDTDLSIIWSALIRTNNFLNL